MANKELQKLKRQDLLELLLSQTKEVGQQQDTIAEQAKSITDLQDLSERLKDKLNEKDAQLETLKSRLNEKDAQIEKLKSRLDQKDARIRELREGGKIKTGAEVSLDLEELFTVGQRAAEQYLKSQLAAKGLVEEPDDEPDDDRSDEPDDNRSEDQALHGKGILWTKKRK